MTMFAGCKCFILPVNLKKKPEKDLIPILKVGDLKMEEKDKIEYLGAMYNKKGNNADLIEHRIKQAKTCMVTSIAMCTDITLGCYEFQALTLTYKSVFVQILLYEVPPPQPTPSKSVARILTDFNGFQRISTDS